MLYVNRLTQPKENWVKLRNLQLRCHLTMMTRVLDIALVKGDTESLAWFHTHVDLHTQMPLDEPGRTAHSDCVDWMVLHCPTCVEIYNIKRVNTYYQLIQSGPSDILELLNNKPTFVTHLKHWFKERLVARTLR